MSDTYLYFLKPEPTYLIICGGDLNEQSGTIYYYIYNDIK